MKKIFYLVVLVVCVSSCKKKNPYDPSGYYDGKQQEIILTNIITYIFDAPPQTLMKDRFKPEHRLYYSSKTRFFTLQKLFITEDGTHFFYVTRPAPNPAEARGVGGHFKMSKDFKVTEFREEFVTPIMPFADAAGKSSFMFDEMVTGNLKQYLKMQTYVQWPNEISYYDTTTYEWKLNLDK